MKVLAAFTIAAWAIATPALAQHDHGASTSPNADVVHCAQAQTVITQMLNDAAARFEAARQSNSGTAMRAALTDVDALMRNLRVQLAPCGRIQPITTAAAVPQSPPVSSGDLAAKPADVPAQVAGQTDEHAGHTAPTVAPVAPPAAAPVAVPSSPSVVTGASRPSQTPPARAAAPAATSARPATVTRPARPATSTPSATDAHPEHVHAGATAPAPPANTAAVQPPPQSRQLANTATLWATRPELLRCSTGVAGSGAPRTTYQGTVYYFCSEHDRQNFLRNPAAAISGRAR